MTALRLWRDCRFLVSAEASDFAKASSDGSADGSVFDWMTVERRPTVDGGRLTEDGYPCAESARPISGQQESASMRVDYSDSQTRTSTVLAHLFRNTGEDPVDSIF